MTSVIDAQKSNWKFRLESIADLRRLCQSLDVNLAISDSLDVLGRPVAAGNLRLPNSLAVHPMEGADGTPSGGPSELTLRRYQRFAAGGAGLVWGEAVAVVSEGRANPRQLWIHEETVSDFANMIQQMRAAAAASMGPEHRPIFVAQLTHSGRYSKPDGKARPLIPQRDPYRDPLVPEMLPTINRDSRVTDDCIVTDDYLDRLQEDYVQAARLAKQAGFDAVDIKSCHGYLINELLTSRQRSGKYGGSFENRVRFLLEVVERIHAELGDQIAVCTRLGCYDAIPYPYGWGVDKTDYTRPDLTEPRQLIGLLRERGVRLINFTIANPYYNPHVGRPFNYPIKGAYAEPEHPLKGVERLLTLAGQIQGKFPDMALVGTGYSWLRQWMGYVGAGALEAGLIKVVGAGRMAFAYPDFAKDLLTRGAMAPEKVCVACSGCTQLMRDGQQAGCVVRDHKVYGPIFKRGRKHDRENLRRLAQECLQCQNPDCQLACPAGIDVPRFIREFYSGDDKAAYQTIRRSCILPEVCAWLCPVEQQCEGACLQKFIGDSPLPIAAIQQYLSEQANLNGWAALEIPPQKTGKRIAVIGAGPAGLAASAILLEAGHQVTLYDKSRNLGGMIESAIPDDRQAGSLVRELKALFGSVSSERLDLQLGFELSISQNLDTVMAQSYDAVFIGLGLPQGIRTTDRTIEGVYDALSFLNQAKTGQITLKGKQVAVVGGGNTAMDAAVTAKMLGARDVYILYRRSMEEMPAWPNEREHAVDVGIHFQLLTQPLEYLSDRGVLRAVKVCPTRLGEVEDSGRRKPVSLTDSSYELPMDVVIEAIGQQAPAKIESVLPGVEFERGLIKITAGSSRTSRAGVFAGGDLVRGADTIVAAVADGMRAGREINGLLHSPTSYGLTNPKQ